MASHRRHGTRARRRAGFTLIEVMITLALMGTLASIAMPSFTSQVRASRRAEAISALSQMQQAQERFRAHCPCYAASLTAVTGCPATDCATTNGLALTLGSARYAYSMPTPPTAAAPNTYTIRATAQGSQSGDRAAGTSCGQLEIRVANGVPVNDPPACWRQ